MDAPHIWRLFCEEEFSQGSSVTLNEDEQHYAVHVLRLRVGEYVELANGLGLIGKAEVTRSDKKAFEVVIRECQKHPRGQNGIHLFLAMPKPATLDEIIASVAQLGLTAIHIFVADKAATKAAPRPEKLVKQARSALRISKLAWQPEIKIYRNLDELLSAMPQVDVSVFCDEDPIHSEQHNTHKHILSVLRSHSTSAQRVGIFVGPEASFSSRERALIQNLPNTLAVSLGDAILTVPVATLVAVSNVFSFFALKD